MCPSVWLRRGAGRREGGPDLRACVPAGQAGAGGQSRGQQGHAGVRHSQPSVPPSTTLCVRSTGHAAIRSRSHCAAQPAGSVVTLALTALHTASLSRLSVRPSVRPSSQGCGHGGCALPPGRSLKRVAGQAAPSEGQRCLSTLSLRDGEPCREHAGPSPRPAVPHVHGHGVAQHRWPHSR